MMLAAARSLAVAMMFLAVASPAAAQWTRVLDVPASDVYSVWANGDTIAAGADSIVYVSTDGGATWAGSEKVVAGAVSVQGEWIRNGRLYAGTYGQGVFVSDDLGDTWVGFNQGLVGGLFDSQLFITDLLVRGDSLFVATAGAGIWVRNLVAGTWVHFGDQFEPNQASNVNAIAAGGSRLLVSAGFNGTVFFRDPGDADWTVSWLDNVGILPGLAAHSAIWTGNAWVVGSNIGVFRSALGEEPWTFVDQGLGTLFNVSFAIRGQDLFATFGSGIETLVQHSRDDGATWQPLDVLSATFVYELAMSGTDLYAGRVDGLWRRSIADVSVPGGVPGRLRFAIAGAQPVRDVVRFRLELPEAGRATIEVFDLAGRRVGERIVGTWPAGPSEVAWDARPLPAGVYAARLTAPGGRQVARIVRVR